MAFESDRLDGMPAVSQLQPGNVSIQSGEATVELRLSAGHDIELYFPAPRGAVEAAWLAMAADVLAHLAPIDNEVQRVSAEQWARSTYPSSYYEGELAYITLTETGEAVLRYSVLGCNSEWDERFVRAGGQWVRVAGAEPHAAADGRLDSDT